MKNKSHSGFWNRQDRKYRLVNKEYRNALDQFLVSVFDKETNAFIDKTSPRRNHRA